MGLCMPQFKSSICTREFLIEMRERKIWIPKNSELKIRHMRWEVTKQQLFEEIQRECQRLNQVCPFKSAKKSGEKEWMIKLLSTLNPEHKFFSQRPEGIRSKSVMVSNHDGLFNARFTPIQRKNVKRPKRYLPFLTKEQKVQIKLEKAKLRQAMADSEVMKLQKEIITLTAHDE